MIKSIRKISLNPPLVLALGFLLLILLGSLLLNLAIFTRSGSSPGYINALFTAGSASCVTGLVVLNTAEEWNTGGQVLILVLIQIGGLGIMTFATLLPLILRQRIGLSSRIIISEQLNVDSLQGIVQYLRYIIRFTLLVEALGALLLSLVFIPDVGLTRGIWMSVFHSVSAFCNAGFDIIGDSIIPYKTNVLVNFTIMALTIIGGLGFLVNAELIEKRSFSALSVHAKLVLLMSGILILAGTLGFFLIEASNPLTFKEVGLGQALMDSLFASVVARTSGFSSLDLGLLRDSSCILMVILMFIGGSPGSTAGGLKTTTFGVLFASTISTIRGDEGVKIFNKKVPSQTLRKALALVTVSIFLVTLVSFLLTLVEPYNYIDIFFEVVSAYATVGVSRGITPGLTDFAKVIITATMYLGRVGPLTMAFAFGRKKKTSSLDYPEANISVG